MAFPFFIDLELASSDGLCTIFGCITGDFSGFGVPATDIYS